MIKSTPIRKRGKRKRIKPAELDITSLLDILVILLVFLLKNYSTSSLELNIAKNIKLPQSNSKNPSVNGVVVQISPESIWVDKKIVASNIKSKIYDQSGNRIIPLFNELVAKKNRVENLAKSAKNTKNFSGLLNLVIDKSVKYSFIKKVLYTSAIAGYKKYKFVVMSDEN
ncbi:biopolymer transporter ExbD [Bacteriovoracaceae bacterium]|nr:biopolymer transporter ExbD [Bacteriovoracaceae bacterium]